MTSSETEQKQALLRKKMDGPVIPWTVGDTVLRRTGNSIFVTYHTIITPCAMATPVGCVLGAGLYATKLSSSPSLLQSMATTGLFFGGLGVTVGLTRRTWLALRGEKAQAKIPWNEQGIQQRVDGLSHNFKVRVLDLSAWHGLAAAAASLGVAGGPVPLGLASGSWGVLQALTLGSSLGGLGGLACIYSCVPRDDLDVDEL